MDMIATSPGRASSKAPSLLGIAQSAATGLWLVAMTAEMASAEIPPLSAPTAETVAYSDLDLSTTGGARVLLNRIEYAAKRICGPEPVHSPLEPRAAAYYRDCVGASVDAAVAQVGSPALLALHKDIQSTSSVALAAR
jgi:UrcA family protein